MGGEITSQSRRSPDLFDRASLLFHILLLSLFLLPSLEINENWPKVQVAEILLPALFLLVVICAGLLNRIQELKTILMITGIYALAILLSMAVNSRLGMLRDHFEVFKLLKFVILMLFTFLYFERINFRRIIKWIFAAVLLFNFLHYIDFMDFNKHIQVYYGNEIHVLGFGVNSLGEPDTKRILGTVGNPNNNAILFMFFTIFFFPDTNSRWRDKIFFYLAVLGVFACQSRTGFIAFGTVYLIAIYLIRSNIRAIATDLLIFAALYLFLFLMGNIYLSSLAGNVMKQNSVRSRIETWKMLFEMIKQKPILGWSPYKEFISDNSIYPEGEYVFVTWKYGVLGLVTHLGWLGYTAFIAWKEKVNREAIDLLLFTTVIFITSITNTPLHDPVILSIFAIMVGIFFSSATKKSGI